MSLAGRTDESATTTPVVLHLYVDSSFAAEFRCDVARQDVLIAGHPSASVGFSVAIPSEYCDDQTHILEIKSPTRARVQIADNSGLLSPSRTFCFPSTVVFGQVDGMHDGALHGWVIRDDRKSGRKNGGLQVVVTLNGQTIGQVFAAEFRPDVAEALGCEPNCGFAFVPPADIVAGRTLELRFRVIPGGVELRNSPYTAIFPEAATVRKVREMLVSIDQLFTQVWALRGQLRGLLPIEHTLQTYNSWARTYFRNLTIRALPPLSSEQEAVSPPMVSVICPTYRPRIHDFLAAIKSVIAQTYQHWELIIVDDASRSTELTAAIRAFAADDPRIRAVIKKKNTGISGATNAALEVASGTYVAFFDHDDLLVERALEVMVNAAQRTGAKLLYCDEDKIDDQGVFSEVNLKPDWNYRLLLSQNYICFWNQGLSG